MVNLYIFKESSRANIYGIGTYIRELTDTLIYSNINACIVHLHFVKPQEEPIETDGIHNLSFPPPISRHILSDWNRQNGLYYRNIVYLLRLHIINTENLVFHLNYNHSWKLAEELKKAFDCRIVTVAHYSDWSLPIYDNLPRLRSIIKKEQPDDFGKSLKRFFETEKLVYSNADRVVCLSHYMHEILCRDYELDASKISVIPNGLTDMVKTASDNKYLREKWKISSGEKVILFAGRMDEIKGLSFLIKAFRKVVHRCPQSRLVIAGDGDFSTYTKESQDICTKITYTGLLDKAQLYEWYCLADAGVVPSLFEPFGYVAVEMMMHGLPVVATATSGLNEVVDETCGLKVPVIQHPEKVEINTGLLAEKILYLLEHPAEARVLGENGRKRYLKEYSSEVFRRNMIEFYQSLSN